jgi:hypothetical protein
MKGPRIGSWGLAGALLAAAVAAVSGCGASRTIGNTIDPVAQAATESTSAPGYRMTLSMSFSSPQLPAPITGTGSGSVQTRSHVGQMSMSMSLGSLANNPQVQQALGGSALRIDEVIDHLTIYMKLPAALSSKLPGAKPWLKLDVAKAGSALGMPGLSALANNPAGSDPSQMLGYLRASSGQLQNLGSASVSGIQTTHYRASIDLDKVAARFAPNQRQAIQQTINTLKNLTGRSSMPIDVWIDQHHLVRRMQFAFSENAPSVGAIHISMQIGITDYGPQPAPAIPPPSQVTDLTSLASAGATGL